MGARTRSIAIAIAGLFLVAILVGALALKEAWIEWRAAEMGLAALLTGATVLYALLVLLSLDQSNEASVKPKLVLDIVRILGKEPVAGIRVSNGGAGPAVKLSFKVLSEPEAGAFKLADLNAIKDGLPSLPAGDYRVLSTGQDFDALREIQDGVYEIEVTYWSLTKNKYIHQFVIGPPRDRHWLTSSLPVHGEAS